MTCIVGIAQGGDVYIGGDSAAIAIETGSKTIISGEKVFVKDEYIIGYSGSYRMGKVLQYNIEYPKVPAWALGAEKLDEFIHLHLVPSIKKQVAEMELDEVTRDAECLIGIRGKIFEFTTQDWFAIHSNDGYAACGSGGDVALGSLYSTSDLEDPKQRLMMALEASSKHNAYVCSPFYIKKV